jgi:hypothetical protein
MGLTSVEESLLQDPLQSGSAVVIAEAVPLIGRIGNGSYYPERTTDCLKSKL